MFRTRERKKEKILVHQSERIFVKDVHLIFFFNPLITFPLTIRLTHTEREKSSFPKDESVTPASHTSTPPPPAPRDKAAATHHVEVLVLVEVVHLEEVLALEAVAFAALEEHLQVLPLERREKATVRGLANSGSSLLYSFHLRRTPSRTAKESG